MKITQTSTQEEIKECTDYDIIKALITPDGCGRVAKSLALKEYIERIIDLVYEDSLKTVNTYFSPNEGNTPL